MTILRAGLHTTIQDGGRYGYQRHGVPPGGAVDHVAFRLANILVGNDPNEGALELTLSGPAIRFDHSVLIALCGGDFAPTIDGEAVPLRRPVVIEAGRVLSCAHARAGARGYLAIAGGIDIPPVLGSLSTTPVASLGGLEGRALRAGDTIPLRRTEMKKIVAGSNEWIGRGNGFSHARWGIWPGALPHYSAHPSLRIVAGEWLDRLAPQARTRFLEGIFTVSSRSDRIGSRLNGPRIDPPPAEMLLSEGTATGAIQLPSDGNPIILLNDHGTTGGYPVIAHVIFADLPLLAQVPPGGTIRFELVPLADAWTLHQQQTLILRRLSHLLSVISVSLW